MWIVHESIVEQISQSFSIIRFWCINNWDNCSTLQPVRARIDCRTIVSIVFHHRFSYINNWENCSTLQPLRARIDCRTIVSIVFHHRFSYINNWDNCSTLQPVRARIDCRTIVSIVFPSSDFRTQTIGTIVLHWNQYDWWLQFEPIQYLLSQKRLTLTGDRDQITVVTCA